MAVAEFEGEIRMAQVTLLPNRTAAELFADIRLVRLARGQRGCSVVPKPPVRCGSICFQ